MGKYPNSAIHNRYSDFHYDLIKSNDKYRRLYVCDIDRLWIEYDFSRDEIVGVMDIKWLDSNDSITPTENGVYNWFEKNNVCVFTVFIDREFKKFKVMKSDGDGAYWLFNKLQYADFLLSLRGKDRYTEFFNNYNGYIELDNQLELFNTES